MANAKHVSRLLIQASVPRFARSRTPGVGYRVVVAGFKTRQLPDRPGAVEVSIVTPIGDEHRRPKLLADAHRAAEGA